MSVILSHRYARPLLLAWRRGETNATTSLDLGLSASEVALRPEGALLPCGQLLSWADLAEIEDDEAACFLIEGGMARKIHVFSSLLDRPYSLMPTDGAPTLINSGFTMHRIVGIEPWEDTRHKIEAIAPVRGRVLDTVTGLGYTAIAAARTAEHVVTVELDPAVLDVARLNPWSRDLFDNPSITQVVGDTYDAALSFPADSFARIMHDPPSLSLAGELYSGEYYRRLFRVLRRGGRLFHYIGNLESRHGQKIATGAIRRLREAGFARVVRRPEAFGLVAYKVQ